MAAKVDLPSENVTKVVADIAQAETRFHDTFTERCDKYYRAWRGIPESKSQARTFNSKLFPPYLFQIAETILASLVDDRMRFLIRPWPRMGPADDIEMHIAGARALEMLTSFQVNADHFNEKQRPLGLQNCITGMTVGKPYWLFGEKRPTLEVVDIRDWFWHEAATEVQSARWVAHRVWKSFEELKTLEAQGIYRNVEGLKEARDQSDRLGSREQTLFDRNRTKDMIEVLEYWARDEDGLIYTTTVGNRIVELKARIENPFDHGEYPFVVAGGMPDLFQVEGVSEIELLAPSQDYLWALINQRLDNLMLANNFITLVREDLDDVTRLNHTPGAFWEVSDPSQIMPLPTNTDVARISIEAEALMKGDLQSVSGGMPFMGGSNTQTVDQSTATGISIISSLGQKRIAAKKQQMGWMYEAVVDQWISLNQQFATDEQLITIIGPDGVPAFHSIHPVDYKGGTYHCSIEATTESLMRQERRAEAQAKLAMGMQLAPIAAAMQVPINLKAYVEDYLRAFDVDDIERYWAVPPPPAMPGPGGPGPGGPATPAGMPAPAGAVGAPPVGGGPMVTSPAATDAMSPSNGMSISPEQFMQRMLAAQKMPSG